MIVHILHDVYDWERDRYGLDWHIWGGEKRMIPT